MFNLSDYFDPVSIERPEYEHLSGPALFSHNIAIHTDSRPVRELGKYRIAILGVPDGRNSPSSGTEKGPDAVRGMLYALSKIPGKTKIVDLGNMKKGMSFNDTLAGLNDVLTMLLGEKIMPVIIGGSSSLVPAADRCFTSLKIPYTLLSVDSRIDYNTERKETDSLSWINQVVYNHKSTLAHFINIGYQTYLNDPQAINRLLRKKSELLRIGDVRQAIYLTEPLFRDSDMAVFDISAVRQSDAPGTGNPSPNGFYGEEICLLARYAGISDNLKIFGLFDVNPLYDDRSRTSALAAQIIWFFCEGFAQKQYEAPSLHDTSSGRFIHYHVRITDLEDDLVFVKSNLTERWWMEVRTGSGEIRYISCSHEDYLKANRNEVPDRWVEAISRIRQ